MVDKIRRQLAILIKKVRSSWCWFWRITFDVLLITKWEF
jgi:hypothetical protein